MLDGTSVHGSGQRLQQSPFDSSAQEARGNIAVRGGLRRQRRCCCEELLAWWLAAEYLPALDDSQVKM